MRSRFIYNENVAREMACCIIGHVTGDLERFIKSGKRNPCPLSGRVAARSRFGAKGAVTSADRCRQTLR